MELTKTSYAVLGMLAIRPWTTYELAQQMQRSLKSFWPRAQSVVYEEPKRLEKAGYARSTKDAVGRRPRTTYAITPKGRRALKKWLEQPGDGPELSFEALLKIFYGEQGRTADVVTNIEAMAAWAARQNEENVAFARLFADGGGPFPERAGVIGLTGVFMTRFADMVAEWCDWADEQVQTWPDDPRTAPLPEATVREIAARDV